MASKSQLEPVANRFLLLANILSTVRIDKLMVPEVIANDCLDAVLDCVYSGTAADVTVLWLYNGVQVYEWRQGMEPVASGVLASRLDLTYRLTNAEGTLERRALRIVELTPELSGDYTCVVRSRGQEARQTKSMIIFSPERDFQLIFSESQELDVIEIKCMAKRLYPQPDLIIEINKVAVAQQQRTWREGGYFEAECTATVPRPRRQRARAELACRLILPQVDYTVITKKYLYLDLQSNGAYMIRLTSYAIISVFIHNLHDNKII